MKAIITVGLGFGDEGKGASVDFLTRELGASLVVRYSGGAQAGHNVELPDGRRHTFAQFGAGTLAGAKTFLGPRMIVSPTTLIPEADQLCKIGVEDPWSQLTMHPECLISTTYHMLMNRMRERARGDARHGSCGLGIGETRHYWLRYGQDAVFAKDLLDRRSLFPKLALLRDRMLIDMQQLPNIDAELAGKLYALLPLDEANSLERCSDELAIASRMPTSETVIFEGAQGILLDEWRGFHPHTTWSTVTPLHALEMLAEYPAVETTVLGITRAYASRHGAGPFPTYCPAMSAAMIDRGNPRNDWQGAMRFGPLDLVLTEYAARVANVDGIIVNCLDELPSKPRVATAYANLDRLTIPCSLREQEELTVALSSMAPIEHESTEDEIIQSLANIAPILGTGRGATHVDRQIVGSTRRVAPLVR